MINRYLRFIMIFVASTTVISSAETVIYDEPGIASNEPESMNSPLNFGQWSVRVLDIDSNATLNITKETILNPIPRRGYQHFMINISVTNLGDKNAIFPRDRLVVKGSSGEEYKKPSVEKPPNAFPMRSELSPDSTAIGNIFWTIKSSDVESLVMYDDAATYRNVTYISLSPSRRIGNPESNRHTSPTQDVVSSDDEEDDEETTTA